MKSHMYKVKLASSCEAARHIQSYWEVVFPSHFLQTPQEWHLMRESHCIDNKGNEVNVNIVKKTL